MTDKLEALSQPAAYQVKGCLCHTIEEAEIYVGQPEPLYSQEYVTALLAALEEKGQSIAELNVKLFDQSILFDAAISRAEASGRREEHLKATVDVLSAKNAELEREKTNIAMLCADTCAKAKQKNDELEQRLQQPIKLPERYSVDCGVVCDPRGDWLSLDDVVKVLGDAGVEVRSPCPRCNRLLDLTSRPDGAHYCHHKVEGE